MVMAVIVVVGVVVAVRTGMVARVPMLVIVTAPVGVPVLVAMCVVAALPFPMAVEVGHVMVEVLVGRVQHHVEVADDERPAVPPRHPSPVTPTTSRHPRARRTASSLAPRSSRAAAAMSPLMPAVHSKYSNRVTDSYLSPRLFRWLMALAWKAAPKPLSMFTTDTPLAQEFNMARRAVTPPKEAP